MIDSRRAHPGESLVEVHSLTKTYQEGDRERAVLRGVDCTIRSGELVVLLGRSGSGKSTLLNLISGIDLPSSGEVIIGGTNLTRLSEQERTLFRREHIGFVFQSFNLIPTLTVAENILLPLELNGQTENGVQQKAYFLLEEVGLRDRADSFPDRLSGGEQQRVAVVRALAHDPLFILADEPTGNLDFETGQQVMDVFDRLIHKAGRTLLIATHDRDIIELADRVLTLHGGVLEEHTSDELI
ncbi:MAG TPA: ABC transporter ATP-binding protein [Rhodothermales bacterium]|nr:ABC transporter ATP-binding protein [Rhodothermales bacterium]